MRQRGTRRGQFASSFVVQASRPARHGGAEAPHYDDMAATSDKQLNRRVAVTELLHVVAELVRDRQPEVANRRPRRQLDMAIALAETAPEADHRERIRQVAVRVAHAAAANDDRMIE